MEAEQLMTNETAAETLNMSFSRFCYRIGPHSILLEPGIQTEVLMSQAIYPVPFTPSWYAGLTSLRGDLLPVIDMHQIILGRSSENPQLLLVQLPRLPAVALTCDGYPQHLKLLPQDLQEHPGENLPGWIPHILHHAGETLMAADHGRLLRQIQRAQGH